MGSVWCATGQEQRALPTALRRTKGGAAHGGTAGRAAHNCTAGGAAHDCTAGGASPDCRFKGPDLRGRLRNCGWRFVRLREAVTKTYPKKKKHEKAMWLSEEACKYLRRGKQERKGKTAPTECSVPEKSKER